MAFVLKQMNACGGQSRSRKVVAGGAGDTVEVTPAVWSYFHADDNLQTIRADGYFNGARQLLSPGDCVVVSPNGAAIDLLTVDTVPLSAGGADVTTGTMISSNGVINVRSFGAKLDGVTDDYQALIGAEATAIETGSVLWIDGTLAFGTLWQPAAGLILRGPGVGRAILKFIGTGDGVEVAGAFDADGVAFDGNQATADRSGAIDNTLFGAHGDMSASPSALSGVRFGHVKFQNSKTIGCFLVNLTGFTARKIEVENVYSQALMLNGIQNSRIDAVDTFNTGDTKASGSRKGTGMGFFGIATSGADWYTAANAIPTDEVEVGIVNIRYCTDSAFYIHDGQATTIGNIKVHSVNVNTSGKDGIKFNDDGNDVEILSAMVKNCALRCCTIDDSNRIRIGTLIAENCGYDAIGDITGTPAPYTGGDAEGESISSNPNILEIAGGSTDIDILSASIKGARPNPSTGSDGVGLRILSAERVHVKARIEDTDNQGARVGNLDGFELDLDIIDAGKVAGDHFVLMDADGVAVSNNGKISVYGRDTNVTPNTNHLLRLNGAHDNIDIIPKGDPDDFNKSFGVMVKIDAAATKIRVVPTQEASDTVTDTTDGSGDITIAHGLYSTVIAHVELLSSTSNYCKVHAITATNFKVRAFTAAGVAQTATSITVVWRAYVKEPNGY